MEKILKYSTEELEKEIIALKEYEERYKSIFDRSKDCIYLYDLKGDIIDASPSALEITGYTPDEMKKINIADILNSDQLENAKLNLRKLLRGEEQKSTTEYKIKQKNGSFILLETRASVVMKEGKPFAIQGIARDITERAKLEEEIRKSESKYKMLIDQALDGILLVDENAKIIEANPSACRMFGYAKEELQSLYLRELIDKEELKANPSYMKSIVESKSLAFERPMIRKDGQIICTEISATALPDNSVQAIIRDVTKRKIVEEKLKISEEKYSRAFSTSPNILAVTRFSDGKVVDVNNTFLREMNLTYQEIINKTTLDLNIWEKADDRTEFIKIMEKDGSVKNMEVKLKIPPPTGRDFLFSAECFYIRGEKHLIFILVDITEKKKDEERIRKSEEKLRALTQHLEKIKEEERKAIAREVHDELGQTLTVIKLMAKNIKNNLTEDQKEQKEEIDELTTLVSGAIKTVQKITSELRPDILDTSGLIAAVEWQVNSFQTISGIESTLIMEKVESIEFGTDISTIIFRILQESLTNVLRHSQADKLRIELFTEEENFLMIIRDNGRGITNKEMHSKNSFGLIGMRERAFSINGTLEIESEEKLGTKITFKIPLKSLNKY